MYFLKLIVLTTLFAMLSCNTQDHRSKESVKEESDLPISEKSLISEKSKISDISIYNLPSQWTTQEGK